MSNDFASDFYPDTIRKDNTVGDLLGGNFDDDQQAILNPRGPSSMKRDQDSTDDFEHLEQEFSMRESSRPPNLEIDSSSTISHCLDATTNDVVVEATRNLLDTSVPAFEPELRPVPATPPPSANSDEMDPKLASIAFMANERALDIQESDDFPAKDEALESKFDFSPKKDVGENLPSTLPTTKTEEILPREIPEIFKQDVSEKYADFDIMKSLDANVTKRDVRDFKDDEHDDSWNLIGKTGKFDEAPTKPLPPVPQFDSFDPYKSSSVQQDKYEMSSEFLNEEAMKKGNETGDSEFESEPEPSPVRSVTNKTEIRQVEDTTSRRAPEMMMKKNNREIEVVAPGDIFGSLGLGE